MRLLAQHVREHCTEAGHASLAQLSRGTVSKILSRAQLRPHKIEYCLKKSDSEFAQRMVQVLVVYKLVGSEHKREQVRAQPGQAPEKQLTAHVCYGDKPGLQALAAVAAERAPQPGKHAEGGRDYEYERLGTLMLMAGLDLLTGRIHRAVVERHRSREFVAFLRQLDAAYPSGVQIRLVLDSHSAHVAQETRAYLATTANRFEFVFAPVHGSWLNLVESFLDKLMNSFLRGLRAESKQELQERIERYIDQLNEDPVTYRWTCKTDELSVA